MIYDSLFIISAVCVLMFFIKIIGIMAGRGVEVPVPVLHVFGIDFSNVYISVPSLCYQVCFWSSKFQLIGN